MARSLLEEDKSWEVTEYDLELEGLAPDPEAVYTIRPITRTQHQALIKKFTRPSRRGDKVNTEGLTAALVDYAIVDWRGITGNPPCDLEHKLKLPTEIQGAIVTAAQAGEKTEEQRRESFREPA